MPSARSGGSYGPSASANIERRFKTLFEELPELDPKTLYTLAASSKTDADAINNGLKVLAAGSMDRVVNEFSATPKENQRALWSRMSEARKELYRQHGYKVPSASGTPLWQKPFAGISWVTDKLMIDDLIENAKIVELGQFGLDKITNFADDFAARPFRATVDQSGKEQGARIETRLNQALAQLADEGMTVTDEAAEYMKWRFLEENPEQVIRETGIKPFDFFANLQRTFGGQAARLELVARNIGNPIFETTYQPYRRPQNTPMVAGGVYERFKEINETLKEGKEFSLRPIDAWNRVDNGRTNVLASQQLKLQQSLKGKSAAAFNAALEKGRGRSLEEYIAEDEKITPQTPEFSARYAELQAELNNEETKKVIEEIKRDQSKVSVGREFAKSLFIDDKSTMFTIFSGVPDFAVVMGLDPFLLAGKGFKVARLYKAVAGVDDIAEIQKFATLGKAGAKVDATGKVIFRPLQEVSDDLATARTRLSELQKAGEDTTKQLERVRNLSTELASRQSITTFEPEDVIKINEGFKKLLQAVPEDKLDEFGLKSFDDIIDENGFATSFLEDNRGNISEFLDELGKDYDALVERSGAGVGAPNDVNASILDSETGELIEFASGQKMLSSFGLEQIPLSQLNDLANGVRSAKFAISRSVNAESIARLYNQSDLAFRGTGFASDTLLAALTSRSSGQGLKKGQAFIGAHARKTAGRLRHAQKVGAWADRAAAAFIDYQQVGGIALKNWLDDVPDAIGVHNNLLEYHRLLEVERGFGISSADDIFDFWRTTTGYTDLAAGRSTNLSVRGFGGGRFGVYEPKLWAQNIDDAALLSGKGTRAQFVMMPTYKGNKLMRRVAKGVTGGRAKSFSEAIELGVEVQAASKNRLARLAARSTREGSKFLYAITRQLPRKDAVALDDLAEIKRWLDSTAFLGIKKESRDAIWSKVLAGDATDMTIRIANVLGDSSKTAQRVMRASNEAAMSKATGNATQSVYKSDLANRFFNEFGEWPLLVERNGQFRASEWFDDQYDEIQKWINKNIEDIDAMKIGEDDFLTDILAFKRDNRRVASFGTRRKIVEDAIVTMFETAGFKNTKAGKEAIDNFMQILQGQRYSALGNDIVPFGEVARHIGVLPLVHQSTMVAVPNYEKAIQGAETLGVLGKILRQSTRRSADLMISRYWKPLTLLRIGFIPRAVAEEALSFVAKSGAEAGQAMLGTFAAKEKVANVTQLMFKAARQTISESSDSLWANEKFLEKYGDFIEAIGFDSLREYRDEILREFQLTKLSKWDNFGVHASFIAATFAKKIRNLEYALIPDEMKALLPATIRTERQKLLYEKMGFVGVDKEDVSALAKIARTFLRDPANPLAAQVSMGRIGNTIADSNLGGFAPNRGRSIQVKPIGTDSYRLTIQRDREWIIYDLNANMSEYTWQSIAYPYALQAVEPTFQVGFDAVRGVVTAAEAQDQLLSVARQLRLQPTKTTLPFDDANIAQVERLLYGLTDEFGQPVAGVDDVVAAQQNFVRITAAQKEKIDNWIAEYKIPDEAVGNMVELPTYAAILAEIKSLRRNPGRIQTAQWISNPELRPIVSEIMQATNQRVLPNIDLRTPVYYDSQNIVSMLNQYGDNLYKTLGEANHSLLMDLIQNPSRIVPERHWLREIEYRPVDFNAEELALISRYGVYSEVHKLIVANQRYVATKASYKDAQLAPFLELIRPLLNVETRYATLVADNAPIVIRSVAEQQKMLQEIVYQQLARMSRNPATAHLIYGSERMYYLMNPANPKVGQAVVRAPLPESLPFYNVMVNRDSLDYLSKMVQQGRVDELLYGLRVSGTDDQTINRLGRMFLEWDQRGIDRIVSHNMRMLNGDYMPIGRFAFETYEDAQKVSKALESINLAQIDKIGTDFLYVQATPGLVDTPSYLRNVAPDAEKLYFNRFPEEGMVGFTNEGFVANSQPFTSEQVFRYDAEFRNIDPRGPHAVEGATVEEALRDWANTITDEFIYHYKTPSGFMHEVIVPSRRGTFGVDVFKSVPPKDLPGKVYAPAEYVAPKSPLADILRFGFDRVINPPIQAMVRTPQWFMNFTQGYQAAQGIAKTLRNPKLDAFAFKFFKKNEVDVELLRDLWAQVRYQTEAPMLLTPDEIRTIVHRLYRDEILDSSVLQSNEFKALLGEFDDGTIDVLRWITRDAHVEDVVRNTAYARAVESTAPFIDDHNVRSMFQAHVRSIMPFQFAQEAFLKRWVRTVTYSPEAIRRAQLLVHSFTTLPFVDKQPDGETYLVVPFSEAASEFLGRSLTPLFGDNVRIPISVPLSMNVKYMLPGIPNDFGQLPTLSPLAAFPAQTLATHFPEIAGMQTRDLIRPFTGGMPVKTGGGLGENIFESFMPTQYARIFSSFFGGIGRYAAEANGDAIGATKMMAAEALRLRAEAAQAQLDGNEDVAASLYERANELYPPDNATARQQQKYLDSIKDYTRGIMFVKGFLGWFAPSTPRQMFEGMEFSSEYANLLNYMSIEEATAFYLTEHPERQPYTIFTFDKETTAPLPATEQALDWMDKNRETMKAYKYGAPWMLPQQDTDDEFYLQAFADQTGARMRFDKSLDDWYDDMKYAAAGNIYFPEQEAYFLAVEQATSSAQRAMLESKWKLWSDTFKKQNPVFAEALTQNFDQRTNATLDEVKILLDDPALDKADHHDSLREMLRVYDMYMDEIDFMKSDNTKEGRKKRKELREDFLIWGSNYVRENRVLTSFWNTILIPATNLRRQETLLQLTGG